MTTLRTTVALLIAASLSASIHAAAQAKQPADLIVTGGPIYTVDVTRPIAGGFAIRGGRFVFVCTARDVMTFKGFLIYTTTNPLDYR
jgi:hypothetical protein